MSNLGNKYMDKELIANALSSAITLISNELDVISCEDLHQEFEITLAELTLALNEIQKD